MFIKGFGRHLRTGLESEKNSFLCLAKRKAVNVYQLAKLLLYKECGSQYLFES